MRDKNLTPCHNYRSRSFMILICPKQNFAQFDRSGFLTNNAGVVLGEFIRRDLQVEWSRSFAHATGNVVMRAVAWAEEATKLPRIRNRHTTFKPT